MQRPRGPWRYLIIAPAIVESNAEAETGVHVCSTAKTALGSSQSLTFVKGQISTSSFFAKCSKGALSGSVIPAARAIVFS